MWAACSGSGTSWNCTAGSTSTEVQTALNSASDGATITFATGSYSWSNPISLNNIEGVTLICASQGSCAVSFNGHDVLLRDNVSAPITKLIRISGFKFTGSPGTAVIWLFGARDIQQLRVDHNTFALGSGQIGILAGETSSAGAVWGVVDHNNFTGPNNFMGVKVLTGGKTWAAGRMGSQYNLFVEDNTFNFSNNSNLGEGGLDAWMGSSVVFRFNNMLNTRFVNHGLCHGGPMSSEVYGNTISSPTGQAPQYRNIHFQGAGEIIAFNNVVGGSSAGHIALQHFRSDASQMPQGSCTASNVCDGTETMIYADGNRSPSTTYRGYPCWRQPGRDVSGTLKPIYLFQNRNASGAKVSIRLESGGNSASHIKPNRDYYEAVSASAQTSRTSPFNGTSGMGFGTLANRPTTCTTGPESQDAGKGGVGYWATDQGEWNSSNSGPDGQLYTCSATNTWTVHYTPYSYPHPLQEVGSDSSTQPPAPPTSLITTVK